MRNVAIYPLALVTLSTFFFIIINSPVIEWNKEINFPDFLSSFEFWAQAKEKQLEAVTIHLVSFENNFEYLIGILTIAIIPGFCEEYFFRGVLQKNLSLLIKNHHVAILISAFIFSAFHLQFYGFFPRLLLGVLFGYFYYWSGSLTYSIIAHTLNNFFSLTLFYVARNGFFGDNIELDINSSPDIPLFIIIGALIIFCYLIFLLKKSNKNLNE
jgi:membrane protease YdiL (CAAX protease family)